MGERCYGRHGRCYVLNIRWNLDQLQPYTILLVDTIKNRYQETKLERQKRTFACMLSGRIVKRYKLQSYSYQQLGFSVRQWSKLSCESASKIFETKRRRFAANCRMKDDVKAFYMRDDVCV